MHIMMTPGLCSNESLAYGGWPGWVQFVEELPSSPKE